MATYTITLNERTSSGKALMEYLQALGVLMHKVSPKSATKHRLYDPETGKYLNDETMKAIAYHDTIAPMFDTIRYHIDKLELIVDDALWPLPKYRELLFIR